MVQAIARFTRPLKPPPGRDMKAKARAVPLATLIADAVASNCFFYSFEYSAARERFAFGFSSSLFNVLARFFRFYLTP